MIDNSFVDIWLFCHLATSIAGVHLHSFIMKCKYWEVGWSQIPCAIGDCHSACHVHWFTVSSQTRAWIQFLPALSCNTPWSMSVPGCQLQSEFPSQTCPQDCIKYSSQEHKDLCLSHGHWNDSGSFWLRNVCHLYPLGLLVLRQLEQGLEVSLKSLNILHLPVLLLYACRIGSRFITLESCFRLFPWSWWRTACSFTESSASFLPDPKSWCHWRVCSLSCHKCRMECHWGDFSFFTTWSSIFIISFFFPSSAPHGRFTLLSIVIIGSDLSIWDWNAHVWEHAHPPTPGMPYQAVLVLALSHWKFAWISKLWFIQ